MVGPFFDAQHAIILAVVSDFPKRDTPQNKIWELAWMD